MMNIAGRVWKFGDNINTDLMLPGHLLTASEAEQMKAVFAANRPGWVGEVGHGDIIIGGRDFGTGSSRRGGRADSHRSGFHAVRSHGFGTSSASGALSRIR